MRGRPKIKRPTGKALLSRTYRFLRAAQIAASDLPQHASQHGAELPPVTRRIFEQWRLLAQSGLTPTNYYRYRLYRREMAPEKKASFLGFFDAWRWLLAVNGTKSEILFADKLLLSRLLGDAAIPHPDCIGTFGLPRGLLDTTSELRAKAELERFLAQPGREHFFLKPVYGRAGAGHISVGISITPGQQWELLPSRQAVSAAELVERVTSARTAYMAQERMVPHPGLASFGTDVLHTIRFITVLDDDVSIAQAALKIGAGTSPMDNTLKGKGNIVAGIDLSTGTLRPGLTMDKSKRIAVPKPADTHPLTKARIGGLQLPMWKETLEMLERATRCFHTISVLAWDVAITTKGPVIIEGNTDPDLFLTQMANDEGLLATPLGDYLRRHDLMNNVGLGIGWRGTAWRAPESRAGADAADAPPVSRTVH